MLNLAQINVARKERTIQASGPMTGRRRSQPMTITGQKAAANTVVGPQGATAGGTAPLRRRVSAPTTT